MIIPDKNDCFPKYTCACDDCNQTAPNLSWYFAWKTHKNSEKQEDSLDNVKPWLDDYKWIF